MIENIDLDAYSVEQLNALVEEAKNQIAFKKQTRIRQVRNEMKVLADSVGLSVQEILRLEDKARKSGRIGGQAKFRNPANPEQTWTGRGKRPRWLQQALREGAKLQDFSIA